MFFIFLTWVTYSSNPGVGGIFPSLGFHPLHSSSASVERHDVMAAIKLSALIDALLKNGD